MGPALVTFFGVDAGSRTLREADQLIHDLMGELGLPQGTVACTHLIRTPPAHIAVSLRVPVDAADLPARLVALARAREAGVASEHTQSGPAALADGAVEAGSQLSERRAGRAVVYPGVATLTGTVTVATVLAESAIDRVIVLAGHDDPAADDRIQTRGHVRPEWRDGLLTLVTAAVTEGVLAPFEVPDPTPCCAEHG